MKGEYILCEKTNRSKMLQQNTGNFKTKLEGARKISISIKKIFLLALTLTWYNSQAQFAVTKRFSQPKYFGFCSGQIIFDSLGYFFTEYGCEGESTVSLGTYKIEGNKIQLHHMPLTTVPLIKKIEYHNSRLSDSTIHVRLFDRFNDTIKTPSIDFAHENVIDGVFSDRYNAGLQLKYKEASLIFWRLSELYNMRDSVMQIPLKPLSMDIYFNLPGYYLTYHCTQELKEDQITEMLFVNRGLYSMDRTTKYYILE